MCGVQVHVGEGVCVLCGSGCWAEATWMGHVVPLETSVSGIAEASSLRRRLHSRVFEEQSPKHGLSRTRRLWNFRAHVTSWGSCEQGSAQSWPRWADAMLLPDPHGTEPQAVQELPALAADLTSPSTFPPRRKCWEEPTSQSETSGLRGTARWHRGRLQASGPCPTLGCGFPLPQADGSSGQITPPH